MEEDNTTIEDMEKNKVYVSEKVENHISKSQAWKNSDKAMVEPDAEVAFKYKDISIMMDRVNFVIFLLATLIITFVFLIVLIVGGKNQKYNS